MNIAMGHVFNAVDSLRQKSQDVRYLLVNHEGQLLNPQDQYPQAGTGQEQGVNFAASAPGIWQHISKANSERLEADSGLWTWSSLTPADIFRTMRQAFPQDAFRLDRLVSDQFELILIAHRPVGFLVEVRRDSRMLASLGTLLGVSVYGLSMFFYLSGHVRARRAELHTGFAVARAEQLERIKRLEERFQRLFEVSSVGQLVVDDDGRIELANAAAEQLLRYDAGKLKGMPVDALLPEGQRTRHAQLRAKYMETAEARKMGEGRQLQALTGDGTRIPVEIGLNPYTDNGRTLVLVSVIDLSPRGAAAVALGGETPFAAGAGQDIQG
jgi:PAS domain S-box-containing protein